jgi:ketosteroid isomerase-like protein
VTDAPDDRTETNRRIIQQALDAWHQGSGAITDVSALDMVWRIGGHLLASREYGSKQQLIDKVLHLRRPVRHVGTVSTDRDPVCLADGDTVIVLMGRPRDRQRRRALREQLRLVHDVRDG